MEIVPTDGGLTIWSGSSAGIILIYDAKVISFFGSSFQKQLLQLAIKINYITRTCSINIYIFLFVSQGKI
jgi:hypothetical protein